MRKIILLILLCLQVEITQAQWEGFAPAVSYTLQDNYVWLGLRDVNGDHFIDMIADGRHKPNIDFFAGTGSGLFQAGVVLAKDGGYSAAIGDRSDVNKDGVPDMVAASYWDNGIKLSIGKVGGGFENGLYMATDVHGGQTKFADMNNDGKMDIVSVSYGSGRPNVLHVFLGKGDGTFAPKSSYTSLTTAGTELIIADLNKDGRKDVFIPTTSAEVLTYHQKPDGSFKPHVTDTYYPDSKATVADINQDGWQDLICAYPSDSITIRLGEGGEGFSANTLKITELTKPYHPVVCDLNQDGYMDIVAGKLTNEYDFSDSLYYMLGEENGSFQKPVLLRAKGDVFSIQVKDLNADKYPEIVVQSFTAKSISVFLNKASKPLPILLSVFPNPSSGRIFVTWPEQENQFLQLSIVNTLGVSVFNKYIAHNELPAQHLLQCDLSSFSKGVYIVHLQSEKQVIKQKLVLK